MFNRLSLKQRYAASHTLSKLIIGIFITLLSICSRAGEPVSVEHEQIINKDAASIWALAGDFNSLNVWHPAVASSELQGEGTTPGDTRLLTLADGATINEELLAYEPETMSYQYAITESPLPVIDYVSTLKLEAIDDTQTKVVWSSNFMAKDATDEQAAEVIKGIYVSGLDALNGMF